MSRTATPSTPAGMIEREPIGDAGAAVVAGKAEAHEPIFSISSIITSPWRVCCRAYGPAASRGSRPAVAGQVRHDQGEFFRELRRDAVPHHIALRIAVQQKQRRSVAADARTSCRYWCRSMRRNREKDRRGRPCPFGLRSQATDRRDRASVTSISRAPCFPAPWPASRCRGGRSRPASRSCRSAA